MGVGQTPAAFKASIEARLKKAIDLARGRDLHRLRVLIVMERFIARVNHVLPETTVLKGGLALELRLDQARTTKDLDLRVLGSPHQLDDQLRAIESHRPDPDDHFQFAIRPDPVHPTITGDGVKYDGYRYKVKTTLAGKTYVDFGLDVAFGDPILGEPELLQGSDFFEKYEIPAITVRTYPVPSHLAEKLHAYTLPRDRVNMRMKDLVDMPLIAHALDGVTAETLRAASQLTFDHRASHALPGALPPPPPQWLGPYDRLRANERLAWASLDDLHAAAARLVDPILRGDAGTWSHDAGWQP